MSPKHGWHSKKELDEVIQYAVDLGWRVDTGKGHVSIKLYCPLATQEGCKVWVYSTPGDVVGHARKVRDKIDACHHTR